jgi:hypothetical protein
MGRGGLIRLRDRIKSRAYLFVGARSFRDVGVTRDGRSEAFCLVRWVFLAKSGIRVRVKPEDIIIRYYSLNSLKKTLRPSSTHP